MPGWGLFSSSQLETVVRINTFFEWASKMAWWVKVLAAKADNLSSVLGLIQCKERKELWLGKEKLQVLVLNLWFPLVLVSRLQAGGRGRALVSGSLDHFMLQFFCRPRKLAFLGPGLRLTL